MAVIRLKITFWEEGLGWELNAGDLSSSPGKRLWNSQMILNQSENPRNEPFPLPVAKLAKMLGKRDTLELRAPKSLLLCTSHVEGGVWRGTFSPLSHLDDALLVGILIFQWKYWNRQCWQWGGEGFQQPQQSTGIAPIQPQSP